MMKRQETAAGLTVRPMLASDLDAVSHIQCEVYKEGFLEPDEMLRERLHITPDTACSSARWGREGVPCRVSIRSRQDHASSCRI